MKSLFENTVSGAVNSISFTDSIRKESPAFRRPARHQIQSLIDFFKDSWNFVDHQVPFKIYFCLIIAYIVKIIWCEPD